MSILNNKYSGRVKTVFQHVTQGNPQHKNHDFGIFYLKWSALTRYSISTIYCNYNKIEITPKRLEIRIHNVNKSGLKIKFYIYVKSSLYFFLVIFNLYFGTFEFGARDM
jgi:hypothetical protein